MSDSNTIVDLDVALLACIEESRPGVGAFLAQQQVKQAVLQQSTRRFKLSFPELQHVDRRLAPDGFDCEGEAEWLCLVFDGKFEELATSARRPVASPPSLTPLEELQQIAEQSRRRADQAKLDFAARHAVNMLNSMLQADPTAMHNLCENRALCGEGLINHPS